MAPRRELNAMLKKWLQKEYISKKQYFFLHSSDSTLPKAYGLPKIHKKNVPFRIIVSSVNTALYNIATFLQKIIADSIPKPKSHVNNSFELCTDLSKINVRGSEILISLDAVSLFTNVPSELVVEGLKKRWKFIKGKTSLSRAEFITAVKFVLASTFFTFNGVIYKQTFGSPMGSPLSPTLADIVMEDLEEGVLGALDVHLSFYKRYVDDIIMLIPRESVRDVLDHFNSYHVRLNFTIEYENNGCLSFLDLMLIKGNTIITDWFHKDTFSGRLLSYFSNHPIQHKIGTIYSLVDRAIMLSHPIFYNKNLNFVINVLLGNGYPIELIFSHINKRLRRLQLNKHNDTNNDSEVAEEVKKFIVMPYLKHTSEIIASVVDKSENSVGYRILNNLSSIIKVHKDRTALFSNNDVVYKICCNNCDASYVGQTKRQLQTRLKEHRNNIRLDVSKHSVVSEHIAKFNHSFDWENTRILEIEHDYKKRLTAEMIHIKEQTNGINLNKDTELLNDAYFDILNRLS